MLVPSHVSDKESEEDKTPPLSQPECEPGSYTMEIVFSSNIHSPHKVMTANCLWAELCISQKRLKGD